MIGWIVIGGLVLVGVPLGLWLYFRNKSSGV